MISYNICLSRSLTSLSIISRSIHVAENGIISFFFMAESFNCFLFQNCFGGSESFAFPCNSHIQNLEKNNEFFHRFLLTRILYEIRYAIVFILLTIKVMILTDSLSIDFFIHRFFCCLNLFFFVSTYKWIFFFLYLCVATK